MNSANQASFSCPKCLGQVPIRSDQAGTRVQCPQCGASLTAPTSVAADNLFDDLFDDEPSPTKPPVVSRDLQGQTQQEGKTTPQEPEAESPGSLHEDISIIDDLEILPTDTTVSKEDETTEDGRDPFEFQETKPLRIEGISDDIVDPDAFYFVCPVCDSKIHVRNNQIGEKVQCADCLSEITITAPEAKSTRQDPWKAPARIKDENDSDDDFKLEAPIDRPSIGNDFGLEEVSQDLLAPKVPTEEPPQTDQEEIALEPILKKNVRPTRQRPKPQPRSVKARDTTTGPTEPERSRGNRKSGDGGSAVPFTSAESKPISFSRVLEFNLLGDLDFVIRTIVAVVFLTFCYTMMDSVWLTFAEENRNWGEKFNDAVPSAFGAFVCFLGTCWFVTITFSVLMRTVANGLSKVEEWVGFAPAEWLGSFLVVFFSGWVAMLPGALMGYVLMQLSGWFVFVPFASAVSAFVLAPFLLICSFYNESVWNIYSPEIAGTITQQTAKWKSAYQHFGIVLGVFLFSVLLTLIPGALFSLLGAAIQIGCITALAILVGIHAKSVIDDMA